MCVCACAGASLTDSIQDAARRVAFQCVGSPHTLLASTSATNKHWAACWMQAAQLQENSPARVFIGGARKVAAADTSDCACLFAAPVFGFRSFLEPGSPKRCSLRRCFYQHLWREFPCLGLDSCRTTSELEIHQTQPMSRIMAPGVIQLCGFSVNRNSDFCVSLIGPTRQVVLYALAT